MRRRRDRSTLLLLRLLALAGLAAAVPRGAAGVPVSFIGTLALQVYRATTATVPGAGVAELGPGGLHVGSLGLPAAAFATADLSIPISDPLVFPIRGLAVDVANVAGTLTGAGGVLPLSGAARLCLFAACPGAPAVLPLPLSAVGRGGAESVSSGTGSSKIDVTVLGAPWTTGVAALPPFLTTAVRTGFRHGPASATSSTGAFSGTLRLVSPILISTSIPADNALLPAVAVLTLHFIPEPGTGVLLLMGIAGAGAVADCRRRASRA